MTSQQQNPAVVEGGMSRVSANTLGHSGNKAISMSLKACSTTPIEVYLWLVKI